MTELKDLLFSKKLIKEIVQKRYPNIHLQKNVSTILSEILVVIVSFVAAMSKEVQENKSRKITKENVEKLLEILEGKIDLN